MYMKESYKSDCHCDHSEEYDCTCECDCRCSCEWCYYCSSRCDCHHHYNRCHQRCYSGCRRNLCSKEFQINLAGLTDGLNYRLRQLLWNQVAIVLDTEVKVIGTITFIGSNFIELLVEQNPGITEDTDQPENEALDESDERNHNKDDSWIIPINKIMTVEYKSSPTSSESEVLL